jgi:hypothetical protein
MALIRLWNLTKINESPGCFNHVFTLNAIPDSNRLVDIILNRYQVYSISDQSRQGDLLSIW